MKLCVKIGGAQLEQPSARQELGTALRAARENSHEVIVVHGGGNQIRELTGRLGIEDRYHDGLRVTDRATADAVTCVLPGIVNKLLVTSLTAAGVPAVGLCGADGATFSARKLMPEGHDLGYVGAVHAVEPRLVRILLDAGFVPVVATVAPLHGELPGEDDALYNINADTATGPLAAAFEVDALLFLTDVAGVLDADGTLIAEITPSYSNGLESAGVIRGGMLPKVAAAHAAAADLPRGIVKVAPAAGEDAVLRALQPSVGTRFVPDHEGTRDG